jgi:CDP-4-dehydro-6-deoxyglucose reductase/ferredoxin-NAD(P)+ reductase (naphthalene dioxygenase ferredoxin-specific)
MLARKHRIRIEGDPQTVPAEDGETVLDALLRNGVGFAYSCQAGNCGTCKCEHVGGSITEMEHSEHALSPAERARGIVLACRARVHGDVLLRRLSIEDFVLHPARALRCRVVDKSWLTHDVVRLRFSIESGGPFTFSAGQFAKLQFPFAPDAPRDYSMANAPDEPLLEFHIRVTAGGVSAQLPEMLHTGDTVRASGPFGTSYLREQHGGPILAVAGGTGLAPIRSIVRRALDAGMPGPIRLYLGVREERDVYGEAELREWAAQHPTLQLDVVVADAAAARPGRRVGLVTDLVREDFEGFAGFHAYLAGPPAMVEAAVDLLRERGLPTRDIHADAFYSAAASQTMKRAVA